MYIVPFGTNALNGLARCACILLSLAPLSAFAAQSVDFRVTVNGIVTLNETEQFTAGGAASVSRKSGTGGVTWDLVGAVAPRNATLSITLTGGTAAEAQVVAHTDSGALRLMRPSGAPDISGGKLVLYQRAAGSITGKGSLKVKLAVEVESLSVPETMRGESEQTLVDQPGGDSVEFPVVVNLAQGIAQGSIFVRPRTDFAATATILSGTTLSIVNANAGQGAEITGFRVFSAGGQQITGFRIGGLTELPPTSPGKALAVEYFNGQFGHYFITANPQEIANLDTGLPPGWARTGQSFSVYTSPAAGLAAVCRFFSGQAFAPKSSHFYAPRGLGCEALLPSNPVWAFEGDVFYSFLPDGSGVCPDGNVPVYRLYNQGQGGAPNHRFTTSVATQLDMLAQGYVAEGLGSGVGMCSPQ